MVGQRLGSRPLTKGMFFLPLRDLTGPGNFLSFHDSPLSGLQMPHFVRADVLRHYPALVTELGGDAAAFLRAAQVPAKALQGGDAYLPFRTLVRLLERSAESLDCADFGLRLAMRQEPDIFGPVAVAAVNCETLEEALGCFSRYFHTHNPAIEIQVRPQRGRGAVLIGIDPDFEGLALHRQFDERALALLHRMLGLLSDGRYRPQRVLVPHARMSPAATYRACFRAPVEFDQPLAALEVAAADLQLPVRGANPQLRQLATAFLESQGRRGPTAISMRVREAVKSLLPSGNCDHVNVAGALLLHPRTLQRRLLDEGTSFEDLRDAVRRELAERYLKASRLPLSQVTALLGYSEQSALTRSCRRWFRLAPLALRKTALE